MEPGGKDRQGAAGGDGGDGGDGRFQDDGAMQEGEGEDGGEGEAAPLELRRCIFMTLHHPNYRYGAA